MALRLNKRFTLFLLGFLWGLLLCAQESGITPEYKDYKDKDQFETFYKRRKKIAVWQINQLHKGALVVRLRTNKHLLEALQSKGENELARKKAAEQFVVNKNTMMAYLRYFNFCKVYFIYSSSSDSLLNGARKGIFLDTNLRIQPNLEMTETFYLLAERDMAFNSSIGFVKEDSARLVIERGNPVKEMGVVLKNKYGHQLKAPMPYYEQVKTYNISYVPGIALPQPQTGTYLWFPVSLGYSKERLKEMYPGSGDGFDLDVRKPFLPEKMRYLVSMFNDRLFRFYKIAQMPDGVPVDKDIAPFLY